MLAFCQYWLLFDLSWPFTFSSAKAEKSLLFLSIGMTFKRSIEKDRLKCAACKVHCKHDLFNHFQSIVRPKANGGFCWRGNILYIIMRMTGLPQKLIWKVCCSKSANKNLSFLRCHCATDFYGFSQTNCYLLLQVLTYNLEPTFIMQFGIPW